MRLAFVAASVCLALAAGPALAQTVDGFTGTLAGPTVEAGEASRAFADIEPEPLPMPPADEIDRDLFAPLDAEMFGTVTQLSTGEVETAPPSQAVIDALKAQSTEAPPSGDSADRAVFGTDERERINDATAYPFRAVGYLTMEWPGNKWTGCSGTLIDRYTVLTAAHCVWKGNRGGFALSITFAPGSNSPRYAPYGRYPRDQVSVLSGYMSQFDPDRYLIGAAQTDLAVVNLASPAGDEVGWFGLKSDEDPTFDAHILGYPADKPDEEMWRSDCTIAPADKFPNYVKHWCDTFSGTSGASIYWVRDDGARYVRGVNVGHWPDFNVGVRINSTYFAWIKERKY